MEMTHLDALSKRFHFTENKILVTKLNVNKFGINDALTRLRTFLFDIITINITARNYHAIVLDQPGSRSFNYDSWDYSNKDFMIVNWKGNRKYICGSNNTSLYY